eukprot:scaffold78268_cov54-Phaeocystis_antarctica.AAC.5
MCGQGCRRAGVEVACHRWSAARPLRRRGAQPLEAAGQGAPHPQRTETRLFVGRARRVEPAAAAYSVVPGGGPDHRRDGGPAGIQVGQN